MFPLRDSVAHHGPAFATKLLLGLNVLVFFWQVSGGPDAFEFSVFRYGFIPQLFFADPLGQAYRLITSMFMHGSIGHIIGNLWFLWVFGPALESRLGSGSYLGLYLLSGTAAALAQGLMMPSNPTPMVGASGAISGVLGGYLMLFPGAWVLTAVWFILPFFFWLPAATYIGYWALFQVIYGLFGLPGVAWWAHLGGFVVGLMLARGLRHKHPYRAEPFYQRGFEFD
jgi:membrane associated rhomboid family serine protease